MSIVEVSPWSVTDDLLARAAASLQLTKTQYELAVQRYETIGKWLSVPGTSVAKFKPGIYPQGSLRIGTTVRPIGHNEYDLDLVCLMDLDWSRCGASAVLDLVESRLAESDTYRPMLAKLKRCVRISYANQFHMDILPAAPDVPVGSTNVRVPDRKLAEWKCSNPPGYADWFEEQAAKRITAVTKAVEPLPAPEDLATKPPLKIAVQILKRWRDVRYFKTPELAPISIVLTTLAGTYYAGEESPLLALTRIVDQIVGSIPMYGRLVVLNPRNVREDLSERWDNDRKAYDAFVDGMIELRDQLRAIETSASLPRIAKSLGPVVGDDIVTRVITDQGNFVQSQREADRLRVTGTGALTTVSGTPLTKNTFYGS
jgi:hypothetical protein